MNTFNSKILPIVSSSNLKNMLRIHIIERCCDALEIGRQKRLEALSQTTWDSRRKEIVQFVKDALGDMPFASKEYPLNARFVSKHERENYIIENVAFESLQGYETNASVYLPKKIPPPWPAIIVPVGHSGKQFENYQIPAQVFAQCGYAAVTFDPPGQLGEKQLGNDHFKDGVRCYMTGHSSNRYFVVDALRTIDYLETRDDINMEHGVAATGHSGGGHTTVFAALIDDRIKCVAPTCVMTLDVEHPVKDGYGLCPEPYFFNRFGFGVSDTDLLCALAPKPLLLMAGKEDEIFMRNWSQTLYEEVEQTYITLKINNRLDFFMDDCAHQYTIKMALKFIGFLNKFLLRNKMKFPNITKDSCELLPPEMLKCYPRTDSNIYSMNKEMALSLELQRSKGRLNEKIKKVIRGIEDIRPASAVENLPFRTFTHNFQHLLLKTENAIELPAAFIYPYEQTEPAPAILFFDDQGREPMLENGFWGQLIALGNKDLPLKKALLTVDLRGWGDSKPCLTPFDTVPWASPERWMGYVSSALGDHVLAMRIRDALASLYYLQNRPEVDKTKIIVAGRGMGAVVAVHVAAASCCTKLLNAPPVAGLVSIEMLVSFISLCESENYEWSHDAFLPNVLLHYDIPQLIAGLKKTPLMVLDPLDAEKRHLSLRQAKKIFQNKNKNIKIIAGEKGGCLRSELHKWMANL